MVVWCLFFLSAQFASAVPAEPTDDRILSYLINLVNNNKAIEAHLWVERLGLQEHPTYTTFFNSSVPNRPSLPRAARTESSPGLIPPHLAKIQKAATFLQRGQNIPESLARQLASEAPPIQLLAKLLLNPPTEDLWIQWFRAYRQTEWPESQTLAYEGILALVLDTLAPTLLDPLQQNETRLTLRRIFFRLRGQLHPRPDRRHYLAADLLDLLALGVPVDAIPRSLWSSVPEELFNAFQIERLFRMSFIEPSKLVELLPLLDASETVQAILETQLRKRLQHTLETPAPLNDVRWPQFLVNYLNQLPPKLGLPTVWTELFSLGLHNPIWAEALQASLLSSPTTAPSFWTRLLGKSAKAPDHAWARFHIAQISYAIEFAAPYRGLELPSSTLSQIQSICSQQFKERIP